MSLLRLQGCLVEFLLGLLGFNVVAERGERSLLTCGVLLAWLCLREWKAVAGQATTTSVMFRVSLGWSEGIAGEMPRRLTRGLERAVCLEVQPLVRCRICRRWSEVCIRQEALLLRRTLLEGVATAAGFA